MSNTRRPNGKRVGSTLFVQRKMRRLEIQLENEHGRQANAAARAAQDQAERRAVEIINSIEWLVSKPIDEECHGWKCSIYQEMNGVAYNTFTCSHKHKNEELAHKCARQEAYRRNKGKYATPERVAELVREITGKG